MLDGNNLLLEHHVFALPRFCGYVDPLLSTMITEVSLVSARIFAGYCAPMLGGGVM